MEGEATDAGFGAATTPPEPADYARFGAVIYAVTAIGVFVTWALTFLLADDESIIWGVDEFGVPIDEELFLAAAMGFDTMVMLAPLLAVAIGLYYYFGDATPEPAHKPAAIAAAAGTAVAVVLMVVLLVVFEPDGFDIGIGDQLTTVLGVTVGAAITGAIAGAALEKVD